MRRHVLALAGILIAVVAFGQDMQPLGRPAVRLPPLPRDGTGTPKCIVPILIYHSVRDYRPSDSAGARRYIATPQALDGELAWLKENGYQSVTFSELQSNLTRGSPLPPKPVIISFDDDWQTQYSFALPLLKKYGFTATFYVWVIVVGMKNHMTWDEVRALEAAGMEIGCHTMTHPYLTRIKDPARLRREIVVAKQRIEQQIGRPVTTFAYPFGQYDERVAAAVKDAGFSSARSTWPGVVHTPEGLYSLTGFVRTDATQNLIDAMSRSIAQAEAQEKATASAVEGEGPAVQPAAAAAPGPAAAQPQAAPPRTGPLSPWAVIDEN